MFFRLTVIIFLFFTFFYAGISRFPYSTDTISATYIPINLIRGNGFDLKVVYPYLVKILPTQLNKESLPYYIIHINGHYISDKPVFSSVIALPIYLVPVLLKNITINNLDNHLNTVIFLGTLSASIFSAISVTFVFLSLNDLTSKTKSLLLASIYGLGTSTLSISSQQLWQHAASQMFLSISLYFFIKGQKQKNELPHCGLFLGFATLSRFSNAIIALSFATYIMLYERRWIFRFITYVLPSVIFFIWYQITYAGNLFFYKYESIGNGAGFNNSLLKGFLGLLIAPSKGLFVYSPIFLFSVLGVILAWKKNGQVLKFFSIVMLLYILIIAKWSGWQGGWSYGPRMLVDVTPYLIVLLVPVISNKKIWSNQIFKFIFISLAIISVFIHLLGVTVSDLSWYKLQTMFLTEEKANQASFLWSLRYPEIYYYYLGAGGFFGIVSVFSKAILNTIFVIIKSFSFIIFLYLSFAVFRSKLSKS